jgi:VWFA-related protein
VKSGLALALACVALTASPTRGQEPTPFRGGTELVSVYATVIDKDRHLVSDLSKDDFVVLDNGKAQTLTFFSNDIQPITVVVMLDRSLSMSDHFDLVRDAAAEFVKKLRAPDRARIGNFGETIVISPDGFTNDRAVLMGILEAGLQDVGFASPIWTAVDRSITALLHEHDRRVVLLFTDGQDEPVRGQVFTELKDVIHRAVYDEIMVYTIGLWTSAAPTLGPKRRLTIGGGGKSLPPDPGLRKLADESGGGYFELTWHDHLADTFARVADELHHQYWLGFPPAKLDGKEHKLDVKVKRPGMAVQARRTYVAAPAK